MAQLIKCSDCGKKISVNANACPNCGAPVHYSSEEAQRISANRGTALSYIIGVFFIITGLGAFSTGFLPAVLLTVGGVLALPVARRALIERNFSASHAPFVIASAVLIIFGTVSLITKKQENHLKYIEENPEAYAAEQAEISKRDSERQAQNNDKNNTVQSSVSSASEKMDFGTCVQKQNSVKNQIASSGNYNIIPVVQTSSLSIIRVCTNDGSVLLTCNAVDGNMIATESTNRDGC